MDEATISFLLDLNHQFYNNFGKSFAATRRRVQPGVRQILARLPSTDTWLDLGCGSGTLAVEWALKNRHGHYLGIDSSPTLLEEARQAVADAGRSTEKAAKDLLIRFANINIADQDWTTMLKDTIGLMPAKFDGILAFAVLHHIPGLDLRRRILRQVRGLLRDEGVFIHSEWQFQHSERLMARRLPWETVGLSPSDLERGDTLLDWRHATSDQNNKVGLRYVHLFSRPELARLAASSGFKIVDEFESDGQGGSLGLYQVWQAIDTGG